MKEVKRIVDAVNFYVLATGDTTPKVYEETDVKAVLNATHAKRKEDLPPGSTDSYYAAVVFELKEKIYLVGIRIADHARQTSITAPGVAFAPYVNIISFVADPEKPTGFLSETALLRQWNSCPANSRHDGYRHRKRAGFSAGLGGDCPENCRFAIGSAQQPFRRGLFAGSISGISNGLSRL